MAIPTDCCTQQPELPIDCISLQEDLGFRTTVIVSSDPMTLPIVPQALTSKQNGSMPPLPQISGCNLMPAAGLWCWACTVLGQGTEFPSCDHSGQVLFTLPGDGRCPTMRIPGNEVGWLAGVTSVEELGFSDKPGISAYL